MIVSSMLSGCSLSRLGSDSYVTQCPRKTSKEEIGAMRGCDSWQNVFILAVFMAYLCAEFKMTDSISFSFDGKLLLAVRMVLPFIRYLKFDFWFEDLPCFFAISSVFKWQEMLDIPQVLILIVKIIKCRLFWLKGTRNIIFIWWERKRGRTWNSTSK